jgi:hypothetical protein
MHIFSYYLIITVNFTPEQDMKAQRGRRGISVFFLSTWSQMGWVINPMPHEFISRTDSLYPLYKRLVGPQRQSERVWKISIPLGLNPWTVQPIVSRYTDYTIPAHHFIFTNLKLLKEKLILLYTQKLSSN